MRRNGKLRIGVVTKGTPFWEWLIPRLGVHTWTWEVGSKESLQDKLAADPVDVVLFDKTAPKTSNPVWKSPHVKCIVWEDWAALNTEIVEDMGWCLKDTKYRHAELGGLTNLQSISCMAWRKESYDRTQPFVPDPTVPGTLHRVID